MASPLSPVPSAAPSPHLSRVGLCPPGGGDWIGDRKPKQQVWHDVGQRMKRNPLPVAEGFSFWFRRGHPLGARASSPPSFQAERAHASGAGWLRHCPPRLRLRPLRTSPGSGFALPGSAGFQPAVQTRPHPPSPAGIMRSSILETRTPNPKTNLSFLHPSSIPPEPRHAPCSQPDGPDRPPSHRYARRC